MAFIVGTDTFDPKKLGEQGSAVIGSVRHIYYTDDTTITKFNVVDSTSTWRKIQFIEEFIATDNTNKIEVFDGKTLSETLEGKTTSELKITQVYRGWLNSIGKLRGKQLWFAEAYTDDRDPLNTDGTIKFYEIRYVQGKLTSISEEKGDAEAVQKIIGEGAYSVASQKKVFRGITPVNVTSAVAGTGTSTRTITVSGTDFAGNAITLTDLTVNTLMNEITGFKIVKSPTTAGVTSSATFTEAKGANDNDRVLTFTGGVTSQVLKVRAQIATVNGGIFESADIIITF